MSTKQEKDLARAAGRAAMTEPPERRTPDACPFEVGDPQRDAWLEGFAEALDEQPDISSLKSQVRAAKGAKA